MQLCHKVTQSHSELHREFGEWLCVSCGISLCGSVKQLFISFAPMKLLHPSSWNDYELIDSGDFEKLERFGKYTLIRPEPQAIWTKSLSDADWKKMAHAKFVREQTDKFRYTDDVKGGW